MLNAYGAYKVPSFTRSLQFGYRGAHDCLSQTDLDRLRAAASSEPLTPNTSAPSISLTFPGHPDRTVTGTYYKETNTAESVFTLNMNYPDAPSQINIWVTSDGTGTVMLTDRQSTKGRTAPRAAEMAAIREAIRTGVPDVSLVSYL